MRIERVSAARLRECLPDFAALLKDAVDGGASVNFVKPFSIEEAQAFWAKVDAEVEAGSRILLAAWDSGSQHERATGSLVGCVMLALASQPNGRHRAEVQKLLVHRSYRGRGIAKALMSSIETVAKEAGRTLLVLDTERGSLAEGLYERIGYLRAGGIPGFAASTGGELRDNVIFYRFI